MYRYYVLSLLHYITHHIYISSKGGKSNNAQQQQKQWISFLETYHNDKVELGGISSSTGLLTII